MNVVALAACRVVGDTIQSHISCASVSWDEATLQIADRWIAELELLKLCDPCQSQRQGLAWRFTLVHQRLVPTARTLHSCVVPQLFNSIRSQRHWIKKEIEAGWESGGVG